MGSVISRLVSSGFDRKSALHRVRPHEHPDFIDVMSIGVRPCLLRGGCRRGSGSALIPCLLEPKIETIRPRCRASLTRHLRPRQGSSQCGRSTRSTSSGTGVDRFLLHFSHAQTAARARPPGDGPRAPGGRTCKLPAEPCRNSGVTGQSRHRIVHPPPARISVSLRRHVRGRVVGGLCARPLSVPFLPTTRHRSPRNYPSRRGQIPQECPARRLLGLSADICRARLRPWGRAKTGTPPRPTADDRVGPGWSNTRRTIRRNLFRFCQ